MSKRVASLAALPLIGGWFSMPIAAAPRPISMARMRDLLLPGLYDYSGECPDHVRLNIDVDTKNDCLLVMGFNVNNSVSLGFVLTRKSIDAGHYKAQFRAGVPHLVKALRRSEYEGDTAWPILRAEQSSILRDRSETGLSELFACGRKSFGVNLTVGERCKLTASPTRSKVFMA